MTDSLTLHQAAQPHATRPRRRLWLYLAAALVLALGGAAAAGWYLLPLAGPGVGRPTGTTGAIAACHDAVRQRLKAPATARFGGEEARGGGEATPTIVTGWVDSENGFGALVRNRYTCKAYRGTAWRGDDVTFSDW